AGDIVRLGDADLVLYNGLHLEGRLTDTLASIHASGSVRTLAVAETIPENLLLGKEDEPDSWDPHVWMDVSLWQIVTETITRALTELIPENADTIERRAEDYLTRLAELEEWVFTEFARVPDEIRVLVTAHDAFRY